MFMNRTEKDNFMRYLLVFLLSVASLAGQTRAKNVILFLGDGVGLTSLNAASIHGHKEPQSLFLQRMPHVALADTSATGHWVTDAGAAATAIATGRKTANRMLSAFPAAGAAGKADLMGKTILEYAEERGLSTGGISNVSIANPLISAFYAHQEDRNDIGKVFMQVLAPRSGNGIDVVIGPGRKALLADLRLELPELITQFKAKGYRLGSELQSLRESGEERSAVLLDSSEFDVAAAVQQTIEKLSRNPKGYFLVVHADCHLKDVRKSLDSLLEFDKLVQSVAEKHSRDTLILVTADHSYGIRVEGQRVLKSADFLSQVTLLDDHTGEEVPVLARGPGSERVQGFVPNTRIFDWIVQAYGWTGIKR
jgi:alkaline phosphatase